MAEDADAMQGVEHPPTSPRTVNESAEVQRGLKRKADDDDSDASNNANPKHQKLNGDEDLTLAIEWAKLSKNQQRKLRRQQHWEAKKKEKRYQRKERRREKNKIEHFKKAAEIEAEKAAAAAEGRDPILPEPPKRGPKTVAQVPVSIIIDCQYEEYMQEKELVSLASQITRCYSDNRNAPFPVHLSISSYGGKLKERYEKTLKNQHLNWKNVHFVEGDFVEAANQAATLLEAHDGGVVTKVLAPEDNQDAIFMLPPTQTAITKRKRHLLNPQPEDPDVNRSIVYLTADSPYTINRLEPNTSYVIGGLIDKNREVGLCYKVGVENNVRTAKLPIHDYMVMQSRYVLATNHVMEIMLGWLETGDWGEAFMKAIPSRKGGKLRRDENKPDANQEDDGDAANEDDPEDGSEDGAEDGAATTQDNNVDPPNADGQEPNGQEAPGPLTGEALNQLQQSYEADQPVDQEASLA
ncbi:hypothetical protein M426DRAFT_323054 [Hypoxylon sp. CI-4A]|nr:hypothetical protein M426DRAFT_323054 [Hypoxylon sp. CI-4A]